MRDWNKLSREEQQKLTGIFIGFVERGIELGKISVLAAGNAVAAEACRNVPLSARQSEIVLTVGASVVASCIAIRGSIKDAVAFNQVLAEPSEGSRVTDSTEVPQPSPTDSQE